MIIPNQQICESIGSSIAKITVREADKIGAPFQQMRLVIVTPSDIDYGAYYPAESVEIYSLIQVTKLRDLLNKAIAIAHKGATEESVDEAVNQIAIDK